MLFDQKIPNVTDRPLSNLRVLSLAAQFPGPYAGLLLADMGADVTLVERPDGGDPARQFSPLFESLNRQKRSLVLDLKVPGGVETFHRLASDTDVILEGFRPGVADRLGVGYQHIQQVNPGIIYVSISGYGQYGPYRDRPGHDLSYQGLAGLLSSPTERKEQDNLSEHSGAFRTMGASISGLPVADLASGTFAAWAILIGLVRRMRTGEGGYFDVSMADSVVSWMTSMLGPLANDLPTVDFSQEPGYGVYETADGRAITVSIAHEDLFWESLSEVTGLKAFAHYSKTARREHRDIIVTHLREAFRTADYEVWARRLSQVGVPFGPVLRPDEVMLDPQIRARHLFQWIPAAKRHPGRWHVRQPVLVSGQDYGPVAHAPSLGENSREVLLEYGFSESEIDLLISKGAVGEGLELNS